jgi:hypothetical protein
MNENQQMRLQLYVSIFSTHPGVDSASNRNEYKESFLGVKTAGV